MSNGRFSGGSVALAFLLGSAVGAGLALLLAPKSGTETRELLKDQASVAKDEALKVADEVKEKATELIEKSKEVVESKKAVIESALEAGKEAMEKEKERLLTKIKFDDKANEA
ncbi:MAG: YtxH domain-containing protein [Thermodesulfobacteria bacterium]|nr:YtxH domain-containing protein [Thermodesulfobacteriota bacterium]